MKIKFSILRYLHLDNRYSLLTTRNVKVLAEYFKLLDIHDMMSLNDIQFSSLMHGLTDLSEENIYIVFDMLDVDASGMIDFDEFYLLICILIAIKDRAVKHFIYHHSRTVFDLLDNDGSGAISGYEFERSGFLFSFQGQAVKKIFHEFDVSGDQELDYREFRMFAMACVDKQNEIKEKRERKALQRRLARQQTARYKWKRVIYRCFGCEHLLDVPIELLPDKPMSSTRKQVNRVDPEVDSDA